MNYYPYPGPYMVPGTPHDTLGQLRAAQGYQIPGPAQMPANATQMTPQAVPEGGIIWVQGEAGAKAYMVAPGNSVLLMDSEGSSFYIKSADCSGFYDTQNAINGLGMNVMQGFNAANVTALQNSNAIQAQLADCCCGTQRAIDAVRYDMAKGDCATLTAINTATRDIVDNANQNTRAVLDYLYQDKLSSLQAENQALRLSASQAAQNSVIGARIDAATAEILRRTGSDCPVPAYVVQPPQPVGFAVNCNGQAVMGRPGCGPCAG